MNHTDIIEKIYDLQVAIMINGGGQLNLEVDKQTFDILSFNYKEMIKYQSNLNDKTDENVIIMYGPMCKTIIRKIND